VIHFDSPVIQQSNDFQVIAQVNSVSKQILGPKPES